MQEFHLGEGRIPIVSQGSSLTDPELPKAIDPKLLEGVPVAVYSTESAVARPLWPR